MTSIEQSLLCFLRQLTPISEEEFKQSITCFTPRILQKGDFLVKRDSICREIAYIHKGILRTFYFNENGEDITSCFCTENCFTTSYRSLVSRSPSQVSIQALELTELLIIDYTSLEALFDRSMTWQKIGRLLIEKEYLSMEKYASVLNNETAREKYVRLLKEQPQILQRAPVQYIASYLGISRETLSRIRKQVIH